MGFDRNAVNYLIGEKRRGVDLGKTLTLGHQSIYMDHADYSSALASLDAAIQPGKYSDELLSGLGCTDLHIMDASDYEGATIIHDLNEAIPDSLRRSFDCVIDGGTLEHVFNFPVALANCMEMVKQDGLLVLMTPWHNYAGHGLYQFSPELFYAALSEANGYAIERMLISVRGRWYRVLDPSVIRARVEIQASAPVMLHITARRKNLKPVFENWPQQSDYVAAWSANPGLENGPTPEKGTSLKDMLVNKLSPIRALQVEWRNFKRQRNLAPGRNRALQHIPDDDGIPQHV